MLAGIFGCKGHNSFLILNYFYSFDFLLLSVTLTLLKLHVAVEYMKTKYSV